MLGLRVCGLWLIGFYSVLMPLKLQAQFNLIGDAINLGDGCYRLTEPLNNQFGAIWSPDLINLNESFEAQFQLYFGTINSNGADGIAFVFQPISDSEGTSGGGIGFAGISPSIGVVFDTWQNGNNNDPAADHVALMQNGNLNHNTGLTPAISMDNIEDGMWHDVRVVWNVNTLEFSVFWNCEELLLSYTGDIVNNIFGGNPMVYWGFTSATGGAFNLQSVCVDYISFLDDLPNQEICEGESIEIGTVADPNFTYSWTPTNMLDNAMISNPIASPEVTTSYVLEMTNNNCQFSFYDTVVVLVNSIPVLELGEENIQACVGESIILDATPSNVEGTGFIWSDGTSDSSNEVLSTGTYTVTVSNGNCMSLDEIFVEFNELPSLILEDMTLCEGGTSVLIPFVEDTGTATYEWSNGLEDSSIEVSQSGIYAVTVTENNCSAITGANVVFEAAPIVDLGEDTTLCVGQNLILQAPTAESYLWQDGSTESTYRVLEVGEYVLEVSGTLEDCSAMDVIRVDFEVCEEPVEEIFSIAVPNAFTPNEDGVNDEFKVSTTDQPDDFYFAVFNRWGEKVFETKDVGASWNGMYQFDIQPIGVYVFYVEVFKLVNGELERFWKQGNVTLLR